MGLICFRYKQSFDDRNLQYWLITFKLGKIKHDFYSKYKIYLR